MSRQLPALTLRTIGILSTAAFVVLALPVIVITLTVFEWLHRHPTTPMVEVGAIVVTVPILLLATYWWLYLLITLAT